VPQYPRLASLLHRVPQDSPDAAFARTVIPYLVDVWLDDYARSSPIDDVVETSANNFAYLFDVARERLIAAWGISRGAHEGARDKGRMAGHPLGAGPLYHRGHAIPHSLGGPLDINLVPQRGSVNVGAFRELENAAVRTPGALYFTYWTYGPWSSQTPSGVEQGLLRPGGPPDIRTHAN
jgi:hypothetical protein